MQPTYKPARLDVTVYRGRQLFFALNLDDVLQIGRARPGEPEPPSYDSQKRRLVIAPPSDKLVSREHIQLQRSPTDGSDEPRRAGSITVTNLSRKRSLWADGYGRLPPQESTLQPLPLVLTFEDFTIHVSDPDPSDAWELVSLEHATLAPERVAGSTSSSASVGQQVSRVAQASIESKLDGRTHTTQQLIHWLGETMGVLQRAAGTADYLEQAVEAVDRIVGLDAIVALRLDGKTWKPHSEFTGSDSDLTPSRQVLQQVLAQKRTVRRLPSQMVPTQSLQGISALVAAPILDSSNEVIGALYGVRHHSQQQLPQISELEATMVDVIAAGAAAGIAREAERRRAIEARVQFEQFFTPQLARELERNPQLLVGQDADISVMFCDIVGFSSISGRIGPAMTMKWVGSVMSRLSDVVLEHDGVLVDYIGDELMAMWGAPMPQASHAHLAAKAAAALLECRARIDEEWFEAIGAKTDLRIGIASGNASVGNTGSARKFKYGPLGEPVNLASRLQGAAKYFGAQILMDGTTRAELPANCDFVTRPLGPVRLVNINQPVSVFEILPAFQANARELVESFDRIVSELGSADPGTLAATINRVAQQFSDDLPSRRLAERLTDGEKFVSDVLWHFDTK
ncbi:MAG: hypothetical protein Aurels2KO_15170 [Aureliella sp.]